LFQCWPFLCVLSVFGCISWPLVCVPIVSVKAVLQLVTPWWWTLRGPKHVGVCFRVLNLHVFCVVVSFIRTMSYIKCISRTFWRLLKDARWKSKDYMICLMIGDDRSPLCKWKIRKSSIVLCSRQYLAHCLYGTDDMRGKIYPPRSLCLLGFKSGISWITDWRITNDWKSALCIQIMDVARLEVLVAVCMNITVFVRSDTVLYGWEVLSVDVHVAHTYLQFFCPEVWDTSYLLNVDNYYQLAITVT
jgi:hypothetical protein